MDPSSIQLFSESLESLKKTYLHLHSDEIGLFRSTEVTIDPNNVIILENKQKKILLNLADLEFPDKEQFIASSTTLTTIKFSTKSNFRIETESLDDSIEYLLKNGSNLLCRRCHFSLLIMKNCPVKKLPFVTEDNQALHSTESFFCDCNPNNAKIKRPTEAPVEKGSSETINFNSLQLIIPREMNEKLSVTRRTGILYCRHCLSALGSENGDSKQSILLNNRIFVGLSGEDDSHHGLITEAAFISDHEYLHELCANLVQNDIHRVIIFSSTLDSVYPFALLWLLDQRTLLHHAVINGSNLMDKENKIDVDSIYVERVLYRILTKQNDENIEK